LSLNNEGSGIIFFCNAATLFHSDFLFLQYLGKIDFFNSGAAREALGSSTCDGK
jgi:hypothetical protein